MITVFTFSISRVTNLHTKETHIRKWRKNSNITTDQDKELRNKCEKNIRLDIGANKNDQIERDKFKEREINAQQSYLHYAKATIAPVN